MVKPKRANHQRDLFEASDPPILLCDQHRPRLLPLVQAMLLEILTPTAGKEVGDDEDRS
jgi:hypothetical protein